MRTIQSKWRSFRQAVIAPNASDAQVQDMQRAFYAGAFALYNIQMDAADSAISDTAMEAIINGLVDEMTLFGKGV